MSHSALQAGEPFAQLQKAHLDPALLGKREKLPLRAIRPTAATPVPHRAMADAQRAGDGIHSTKFVDQGHVANKDTICRDTQDGNVACIPEQYGHDTGMPDDKRTAFSIDVGRRLAAFRDAIGLNQDELAEQLNSTRGRISNFENGKRTMPPDIADRIWRTWGVSPNYFYSGLLDLVPDRYREKLSNPPPAPKIGRPTKTPKKKQAAVRKVS